MGSGAVRGVLYVVATPIGNLEDMTFRAVRVLREVDRIACEDTRVSARLCRHYGIDTPLMRHEAHNEEASARGIVELLRGGADVALISDAGTPALSDPGALAVRLASAEGFDVLPIPGASSLTAALSASGLPAVGFRFGGFLPKRAGGRRTLLGGLGAGTHAFFVPARDLPAALADVAKVAPEDQVVAARELTKRHETWYRGTAAALLEAIEQDAAARRGECVLLIHRSEPAAAEPDEAQVEATLRELADGGLPPSRAAAEAASRLGISRRSAYEQITRMRSEES